LADEPSWDDIFRPAGSEPAPPAPQQQVPQQPAALQQPAAPAQPAAPQYAAPQQPAAPQSAPQQPAPQQPAPPSYSWPPQPGTPQGVPQQPVQPEPPQYPAAPQQPQQPAGVPQEPARPAVSVPDTTGAFPTVRSTDPFAVAAAEATAQAQAAAAANGTPENTLTRRQLREMEEQGSSRSGRKPVDPLDPAPPKKKRRGLIALAITLVALLVIVGGGTAYALTVYRDKVCEIATDFCDAFGLTPVIDYEGTGNGEEAVVIVRSGDYGDDIARTLHDSGVTMTFQAVYQYLIAHPDITFEPGNYRLQKQMSAESAVAALRDPANRIVNQVVIPEGMAVDQAFVQLSAGTGIPVEDFTAAAEDYTQFGVPEESPGIEGWLFPATYTFDPGLTAEDVIQQMVDVMISRLDGAGVEPEDRLDILRMAALVQRESGPNVEDMRKIARVFYNRLAKDMRFESDATVAYGTGNTHTVWTTAEERADPSNPYNTYVHKGMPYGPIGLPGMDAINAAIDPANGPWLFFVPVNLKTGETVFSETADQHQAAAERLYAWCRANAENASYCE